MEAPQQASEWQESATARKRRNTQREQAERTEVFRQAKDFEPANREVEPSMTQWEPAIYTPGSTWLPKFQDQAMKILQVTYVQAMELPEHEIHVCDETVGLGIWTRMAVDVQEDITKLTPDGMAMRAAIKNKNATAQSAFETLDAFFQKSMQGETELHISSNPMQFCRGYDEGCKPVCHFVDASGDQFRGVSIL